ncbi:MAG: transcription elongation factor Spt5 [Nitrososphaerota archaeon]
MPSPKYFAVKTTVGQERNIAKMLETKFQGVVLKSGETFDGSVDFGGDVWCWQSFRSRKTIHLKELAVFVGKGEGAASPISASIHRLTEDGSPSDLVADLLLDPLLLKDYGWHSLKPRQTTVLKRNESYVLILSSKTHGYLWYYVKDGDETFEGEARVSVDNGVTWSPRDFKFLIRLVEDVDVASILILPSVKGYIFVEAGSKEAVATAVQNVRHIKNRPLITVGLETLTPHLVETPLIDTIDVGQMVEIVTGPLRGIVGRVIRVEKPRREVTLELREAAFQLPISVSIDAVRPLESASASRK